MQSTNFIGEYPKSQKENFGTRTTVAYIPLACATYYK